MQKGKASGTPQSSNKSYYSGNIPFLSIADITKQGKYIYRTEKHISEAGLQNSTAWIVPNDSLILSMYASYGLVSINKVPLATSQRIYDKRKGNSYINIGSPKTASSERVLPFPSLLANIIKKFYSDNPNQYFLTGKVKPTEPRTYQQFFTRFLKRNNLRKVKFHEIRHTFAVRAIEIPDFDIKSSSEILGHKNVLFTLNVYGRANLKQKIKCMNLLNDLL